MASRLPDASPSTPAAAEPERDAKSPSQNNGGTGKEWKTYRSAVASGFYQRDTGGLQGKHDNVRRYWEDQITRYALHDFIAPLVDRKKQELSRVRVLDLGAGSGEGYEILTSLKKVGVDLASREVQVLPGEMLGYYRGLDISPAMVALGQDMYADVPKVDFTVGDLSQGLEAVKDEEAFDLYFSSYGSLSHLRDAELERLLEDVCEHFSGNCTFVADLVARYSYEWQCYWGETGVDETNMRQYSMSYLYPEEMLSKIEVERFPLRYWGASDFDAFLREVCARKGVRVVKHHLQDRSVLVGRHMNTGEFNPHAKPLRDAVNHLHHTNLRTDLSTLLFDYTPKAGYPELNAFFETFQMAWNAVVYSAIDALERWDDTEYLEQPPNAEYPDVVQSSIQTIRDVVRNVKWFRMGDPRASVVEPQLGYILRNLEVDMQRGLGAAHGLLAIYELEKD